MATAASVAVFAAQPAAAEARRRFDIPAQDAASALRLFARQAGRQLLFPYDAVRGRRTPALAGDFTPEAAAARMAQAVGLVVSSSDARTITLGPAPTPTTVPAGVAARPAPRMERAAASGAAAWAGAINRAPPGLLQEVVITATRQPEVLNQAPLSVTAATQRTLDQLGVQRAADMQAMTPALTFNQLSPAVANVAIRGITDTGAGAATTAFYLDDVPLQKRNAPGVRIASGNGTPLPPLFDIERVEVLRGPQGTLFGAGSEGGTIRYVTPAPSLDRSRVYLRTEASTTAGGDPSWEAGLALGAPIVRDRLGFRVSLLKSRTGGYLDYVDPYSGQVRFENANWSRTEVLRAALLWAPTDRLKVTTTVYSSGDRAGTATSSYTPAMPNAIVVPTLCFNTSAITPEAPQNNPVPIPCTAQGVTFVRPGATYGPFGTLGPGKTLARDRMPASTTLRISSLAVDYAFDHMTMKASASLISDQTRFRGIDNLSQIRDSRSNATYGAVYIPRGLTLAADYPDAWRTNGHFYSLNRRYGLTGELRFASVAEQRPLTWVAGLFYSNLKNRQRYDNVYEGLETLARTLYGISAAQRYGVPGYDIDGQAIGFDHKDQAFQDMELAAFGELNWWLSDRLRLTAGARVSRLSFSYVEHHYGPASGFNVPTPANGGGPNAGDTTESPIAPKLGLTYRLNDREMVYVTAAKGFRAGGVNAKLPQAICGPGLTQYGLQPTDVPSTYASDSVWSYEIGGKFGLFRERLQLNGSVYRIDWRRAQLTVDVGNNCGIPFTGNAGTARSQGVEIEAQARIGRAVTADLALGYDDVRYTEDVAASPAGSTPLIVALKDQRLAIPPLTLRIGGRYDFTVARLHAYARADFYLVKGYDRAAQQSYGLPAYAPDAVIPDAGRLNLRLGVEHDGVEFSVFASNVLNAAGAIVTGGRSGCALPAAGGTAACTNYGTYNPFFAAAPGVWPRQIGVQLTYRR